MTQKSIVDVVSDIGRLFDECSFKTFGEVKTRNGLTSFKPYDMKIPWFSRESRSA